MFRKKGASRLTAAFLTAALLAQTIFVIPAFASAKSNQYDRKLQLVTEKLYEDKETVDAVKALDKAVAIISVSDGKSRAKSFSATTGSLSASLEKASEKAKASGITPKWLKLEVVTAVEQKKYSDFTAEVMGKRGGSFRRGIAFNDYFGRVITEGELNANGLIDYETGKLKLTEVNSFLKFLGKKQLDKIPSTLYIFDTSSYFTENTAYAEKLINEKYNSTGRRGVNVNRDYLENLAGKTSDYLAGICDKNGKFVYGYYPIDNEEIEGYNMLRHAGTTWNLILQYEMTGNEELLPVIERALTYLSKFIQYKNDSTAFVISENCLNVGGNGLALLAYCSYAEIVGSDKYNKVIEALANGVIFMQKENGGYVHAISKSTYKVLKDYIIVYYDGEAMYGVLKAYGVTGKKKYLDCARKAGDYFIANNYETLNSHWISYGFNELTKYLPEEKYFEFGLKNLSENNYTTKIYNTVTAVHTANETLGAGFELYDRLVSGGYECDYLEQFDEEALFKAIRRRVYYGQNYFMFPEYAMYFENPQTVLNSFAVREDNFRIRIDDIQHFMGGYYLYWKNYDRISGYNEKKDS